MTAQPQFGSDNQTNPRTLESGPGMTANQSELLWQRADSGSTAIALAELAMAWDQPVEVAVADRGARQTSFLLRAEFLVAVIPKFTEFCQTRGLKPQVLFPLLWQVALPLALELEADYRRLGRPIIQGILGGQGVGKSTLGALLRVLLPARGLGLVSLSLDDIYRTHADRQSLYQRDPRLIWRGPPGTHDLDLGRETFDRLRGIGAIPIPRFDKSLQEGSGDRTEPEWVTLPEILIFEGWFVGARPIDPAIFEDQALPHPICSDADRAFARDCNARLAEYLPLWDRLDRLLVLAFRDYRQSKYWRRRAEAQMRELGKPGMSDDEIDAFVDYFWRALHPELFIEPLFNSAVTAGASQPHWRVRYGADRQIESVDYP